MSDTWKTLTEELRQLEHEDPAVRDASERLDRAIDSVLVRATAPRTRFRKSTADRPIEVQR